MWRRADRCLAKCCVWSILLVRIYTHTHTQREREREREGGRGIYCVLCAGSLSFAPSGHFLAAGLDGGMLRVWAFPKLEPVYNNFVDSRQAGRPLCPSIVLFVCGGLGCVVCVSLTQVQGARVLRPVV